jgi:hypothetical protein
MISDCITHYDWQIIHSEGLEQRLSVRIYSIPAELLHSSKLEPRDHVGPRVIPAELLRSSYEESSR